MNLESLAKEVVAKLVELTYANESNYSLDILYSEALADVCDKHNFTDDQYSELNFETDKMLVRILQEYAKSK